MTRILYVKILSLVVFFVGIFVMIGWIFDIGILKSVFFGLEEMKFLTAVCFMASSIILYSTTEERPERSFVVQMVLPAANLTIFFVMGLLLFSSFSGLRVGIDHLFTDVIPDRPSIFTKINFLLIAIAGTLITTRIKKWLYGIGWSIVVIGALALAGYALNQPMMALHTALLFVLIGIVFVCYAKK